MMTPLLLFLIVCFGLSSHALKAFHIVSRLCKLMTHFFTGKYHGTLLTAISQDGC